MVKVFFTVMMMKSATRTRPAQWKVVATPFRSLLSYGIHGNLTYVQQCTRAQAIEDGRLHVTVLYGTKEDAQAEAVRLRGIIRERYNCLLPSAA
jgi:hypothetical protein